MWHIPIGASIFVRAIQVLEYFCANNTSAPAINRLVDIKKAQYLLYNTITIPLPTVQAQSMNNSAENSTPKS
jgi:hypothetical protein